ncbi:ras-related protein Rap-2c isoform X3 [Vulpes lagopus]|uniref:ras-related protein Rap-2c isoform X3 n=1 Tax=Vulpes lagopus TaxID=494514 RepID=UPI001BC965CC|nr:ras-related protein Rap-2c isoform X3 [Vulpes lagopus]
MGRLKTHRPTSSSRGQCLRYQAGLRPAGARAGDSAGQIAAAPSGGEIEVNSPLDTDIKPMRDQIVRVKRYEKVPLILVGNKVDLEPEREVMSSEGRALAQEWGCPFMETSAKSKSMVDELFAEIVRQMNYSSLPEKQDQCCTTCVVQ